MLPFDDTMPSLEAVGNDRGRRGRILVKAMKIFGQY
jgi:hypothetical protein